MKIRRSIFAFALALPFFSAAFLSAPGEAQRTPAAPAAASAPTAIPALVPFSGVATGGDGKPVTGEIGMTFLIYKDEQGGEPLFTESQVVALDETGHYKIQLGASNPNGLPADLFSSGEARWLEVQIAGQKPQPRVLLASVPYALKAADSATLGGLPASAFALAGSNSASHAAAGAALGITPDASSIVTTPGGTSGYIPEFTGASTIADSPVFVSGSNVGIGTATPAQTLDVNGTTVFRNSVYIYHNGTATASSGVNSVPMLFLTEGYNSSSKAVVAQDFQWKAEIAGNNTAAPSATLNLLYSPGTGATETGFHFNPNGTITFASGQTFPGTGSGNGTITGVTAGSGLTGGGASGNVTLNLNTGTIPTLAANNTFTGSDIFSASLYENIDVNVDYNNRNAGNISPGLRLGNASGEGMASKRTAGGNQYGVDLYTGYSPRLSINASGLVAIGTGATFNGAQLQVQSGSNTSVAGSSSSGSGIIGNTAGTTLNTAGVIGVSQGRSGFTGIAGVWGDTQSDVGVYGSSQTASGVEGVSTNGPGVQGASTNSWAGRFSNSSSSATVYATNAASSGGSALYGVASGASGIGLYTNATASGGTGVLAYGDGNAVNGNSNGDVLDTAGVLGVAGSRTGVGGIAGVWGDAAQHVGVIGSSIGYSGVYGASTNSYGVQAFSANGAAVYAVSGSSLNPSLAGPIGVWGDITGVVQYGVNPTGAAIVGTATNAQAGYFANNSDSPTVEVFSYGGGYGVYQGSEASFGTLEASTPNGTCGFGGNGDMTCTGQVKALATTGNGTRTVETYSMQSPENWMEDFGSGTIQNGRTTVSIDAAFAETASGTADYHVFLTPRGDSKGLYVTNATPSSFEVHESGGGTSTIGFDYRIVAKRRGFETQRMVDVSEAMKAVKARNDLRAEQFKKAAK
jgi:hypothetical protein